jgi:hypothetical protein
MEEERGGERNKAVNFVSKNMSCVLGKKIPREKIVEERREFK